MRVVLAVALLLVPAFGANANGDPNQTRIARLEKSVLAPCCYTEPVASHQSEIAVKIRLEIANWVQQGKTDREILDTYAQRYGARVLVDPTPPGNWSYLVPWSIAVVGSMVVSWILWRWHLARLARTVSAPDPNGLPDLPNLDDE